MVPLSNVVQNAIIGSDNSVSGGAIGAVTLVIINSGLNRAALRSRRMRRVFDGSDTLLIEHGKIIERAARRIGLRHHELDHAVRLQNGDEVSQVETGVLDPGSQLIPTLKADEQSATRGDLDALRSQLDRIESMLAPRQ